MNYDIASDVSLVKELLECSNKDIAEAASIGTATIQRMEAGTTSPNHTTLNAFYDYAFSRGIRLNAIKAQLHREQIESRNNIILFHGAKTSIEGPLSLEASHHNNDFGQGFYCGESLTQSAMFVAAYPASSLYIIDFNSNHLKSVHYKVDQDWMLTVAWFRGKLQGYAQHPVIRRLIARAERADYIVAPIADNRMFEIIDTYIDGEITDVQCQHCLSATNLGNQYVFTSEAALKQVTLVERCFLSPLEKQTYLNSKQEESRIGVDKVKTARKQFRNQGLYIEELLS